MQLVVYLKGDSKKKVERDADRGWCATAIFNLVNSTTISSSLDFYIIDVRMLQWWWSTNVFCYSFFKIDTICENVGYDVHLLVNLTYPHLKLSEMCVQFLIN